MAIFAVTKKYRVQRIVYIIMPFVHYTWANKIWREPLCVSYFSKLVKY